MGITDQLRRLVRRRRDSQLTPAHLGNVAEVFTASDDCQYVAVAGPTVSFHGSLRKYGPPSSPMLVTVIYGPTDPNNKNLYITREWLEGYISRMRKCPVYDSFAGDSLKGVVLVTPAPCDGAMSRWLSADAGKYLKELKNEWIGYLDLGDIVRHGVEALPPGPYLWSNESFKPVLRLYPDTQSAFLMPLKPVGTPDDLFEPVNIGAGQLPGRLSIAVPSTAAYHANNHPNNRPHSPAIVLPLRIVVKDCYHLRGLKNTLCNNAYYSFSHSATSTSPMIASLLKQGAQVLGTTKLASLIAREEPMDAVDFQVPFNPRGDGYQSPAGSSSGSAAAIAADDFVDAAIGTDTTGSGRRPALLNGVWQFRPSHREVYLEGMVTVYPRFDTPCVFARDFAVLKHVAKVWNSLPDGSGTNNWDAKSAPDDLVLHGTEAGFKAGFDAGFIAGFKAGAESAGKRYELVWLTEYLPIPNVDQMLLIVDFVADMQTCLGTSACTLRKMSIKETWKQIHPEGTPADLDEYLEDMVARTFYHGSYHSFREFREEYALANNGRPPYVNSVIQQRWDKGAAVTVAQNKEAEARMEVYKDWLLDNIFGPDEKEKQVIVILPIANVEPNYRDVKSSMLTSQSALDQLFLGPILGAPDVMVPLGDVPYESRITGRTEFLPVVVDLMGKPGQDMQLLEVVEKVMKGCDREMVVKTGARMFAGVDGKS
ncbi:amidase signature domain containing protein [Naviculisporaceae sp. PSN 640]